METFKRYGLVGTFVFFWAVLTQQLVPDIAFVYGMVSHAVTSTVAAFAAKVAGA